MQEERTLPTYFKDCPDTNAKDITRRRKKKNL